MNKYWIIVDADVIADSDRTGENQRERILPNGQALLEINDGNRKEFKEYKKYTKEEIKGLDLASTFKHREFKNHVDKESPFKSNKLASGEVLYTRIHGECVTIADGATVTIEHTVIYDHAKFDGLEIVNAEGCKVDMGIKDTPNGDYSTIPDYVINQYAFGFCCGSSHYRHNSKYDANLYMGMRIFATITNNSGASKEIGMNSILHEVADA